MNDLDRLASRLEVRWRPVIALTAGLVCLASLFAVYSGNDTGAGRSGPAATATTSTAAPATVDGFDTISVRNVASGTTTDRCYLLAETQEQLGRGLMDRDDLGGFPGMVFRFASDSTAEFYMANVRFPLSIAWFDAGGRFVSSAEMEPCRVEPAACPRYPAAGPYRYAIETASGDLDEFDLTDGSVIELGGACAPA